VESLSSPVHHNDERAWARVTWNRTAAANAGNQLFTKLACGSFCSPVSAFEQTNIARRTDKMDTATNSATKATLRCQFCQSWNRIDVSRAADKPKCGKCGKPMLLDRPIHLDDETFARTIAESEVPVLVDFYADWCGPCKMMAPSVDQLAANYSGRAIVAKLNTDLAPNATRPFNIRGIPTTIVFIGGKESARQSGAMPYQMLASLLDRGIATSNV
jgi:thioredoxin 2